MTLALIAVAPAHAVSAGDHVAVAIAPTTPAAATPDADRAARPAAPRHDQRVLSRGQRSLGDCLELAPQARLRQQRPRRLAPDDRYWWRSWRGWGSSRGGSSPRSTTPRVADRDPRRVPSQRLRADRPGSPTTSRTSANGESCPTIEPGDVRATLPEHPPTDPEPCDAVMADVDRVVMPGDHPLAAPELVRLLPRQHHATRRSSASCCRPGSACRA